MIVPITTSVRRRDALKLTGLGVAVALAARPFAAHATPADVNVSIQALVGARDLLDDGRVSMVLPEIAENGGTVPLTVAVASPMSADDHVKALHIFCDGNPSPDMASYFLGPLNGKAEVSMRIRLMQTQKVVVVAETSKGEALVARREIKVTLGGCGG